MFTKLKKLFSKEADLLSVPVVAPEEPIFSTHQNEDQKIEDFNARVERMKALNFQRQAKDFLAPESTTAMDAVESSNSTLKGAYSGSYNPIPDNLVNWYASQGFIGYQLCAILSQHWLIDKACAIPGEDAVRNGYEITVNDGTEVGTEILDRIKRLDVEFKINHNLEELSYFTKVYGVRICIFLVDSTDEKYYEKPFNIDGVLPGTYRGISQVDPYWVVPELGISASSDPAAIDFYEPTWWRVGSKRYHRSHLIITRNQQLPDLLKPTYLFGGKPLTQLIYERVYAAERSANEAPLLLLTKRSVVYKTNLAPFVSNPGEMSRKMQTMSGQQNNYGQRIIGKDDEITHFDTTLSDVPVVIDGQYGLVSSAACVPINKLMGKSPTGLNPTGGYDDASYHEGLETLQTHWLQPLIERHHAILIRSHIRKEFPNTPMFTTEIVWNELDVETKKEKAEKNKQKAETGTILINSGAITPDEERNRITNDPESGYSGLPARAVIDPLDVGEFEDDPLNYAG